MKEKIIKKLKEIEQHENVKILYACESGSRAWGFPSEDSDYDVRFIYLHPPEWYLSIFDRRDVIERPINDLLDINGWDLRKALQLFRKSNPSLLEWLQSPIYYYEAHSVIQRLQEYVSLYFSPKPLLYHYLNMAKGNCRSDLQGTEVKAKKYFTILRPILASMWIDRFLSMPPIEFERLIATLVPTGELMNEISLLVERKKAGDEFDHERRIPSIDAFIHEQLSYLEERAKTIPASTVNHDTDLDQLFRDSLMKVWGL